MDIGRSCHATFSIVNRQSAIGNENLALADLPRQTVKRRLAGYENLTVC
jgi:hypothetical protein